MPKLKEAGRPNLCLPRDYFQIDAFPMLSSGKLDLKRLNNIAEKLAMG